MLFTASTVEREEQCRHPSGAHPLPPVPLQTRTGTNRYTSNSQCRDAIMKVVLEFVDWIMGEFYDEKDGRFWQSER